MNEEENILFEVRNVALDVQATSHMIQSYTSGQEAWTCTCSACEYLRKSPKVTQAIARAIIKNYKKS